MRYDSDDDYQTQEGTTQEGTYAAVRRTEEYIHPNSDEESVDLPINPPVPTDPLSASLDQNPPLASSPVPSSTASERIAPNEAFLAAGCDDDWLHYTEYDPLYQLIPQGFLH